MIPIVKNSSFILKCLRCGYSKLAALGYVFSKTKKSVLNKMH